MDTLLFIFDKFSIVGLLINMRIILTQFPYEYIKLTVRFFLVTITFLIFISLFMYFFALFLSVGINNQMLSQKNFYWTLLVYFYCQFFCNNCWYSQNLHLYYSLTTIRGTSQTYLSFFSQKFLNSCIFSRKKLQIFLGR